MEVLLPASEEVWQRARQLSLLFSTHAGGAYRITTTNLEDGLAALSRADYVVLIHGMPEADMRAFIEQALEVAPQIPLVIVDVPDAREVIGDYLMDGISCCLLLEHDVDELATALRELETRRPYLPHSVQAALLDQYLVICNDYQQSFGTNGSAATGVLTEREQDVLELVAEGLSNRVIAERLFIEIGTVKNHVHSILTKLDVGDREAAAQFQRHMESYGTRDKAQNGVHRPVTRIEP